MKFHYEVNIIIPKTFLSWLKKNKFVRIGKTFSWKSTTKSKLGADYEIIKIIPYDNSYRVLLEYWGKAWSEDVYAYDVETHSCFSDFLANNNH